MAYKNLMYMIVAVLIGTIVYGKFLKGTGA